MEMSDGGEDDAIEHGRAWAIVLGSLMFRTAGSARRFGEALVTSEIVGEADMARPESVMRGVVRRVLNDRPELCVVVSPCIDIRTGDDTTMATVGFMVHSSDSDSPSLFQCDSRRLCEAIDNDRIRNEGDGDDEASERGDKVGSGSRVRWSELLEVALTAIMAQSDPTLRDACAGDGDRGRADALPVVMRSRRATIGGASCVYRNYEFDDTLSTLYDGTVMFLATAVVLVAYARQHEKDDEDGRQDVADCAYRVLSSCIQDALERPWNVLNETDTLRSQDEAERVVQNMPAEMQRFDIDEETGWPTMPAGVARGERSTLAWLIYAWEHAAKPRGVCFSDFILGAYVSKMSVLESDTEHVLDVDAVQALLHTL